MPPQTNPPPVTQGQMQNAPRAWNKFAIVVLVLAVLGFFTSLLLLLTIVIGEYSFFILTLVSIVGIIFGVVALRQLARTGEKGKIAVLIGIMLFAIYLLTVVLFMFLGFAITA